MTERPRTLIGWNVYRLKVDGSRGEFWAFCGKPPYKSGTDARKWLAGLYPGHSHQQFLAVPVFRRSSK